MNKKIFKKSSLVFTFLILLNLIVFSGCTKKNEKIKLSIVVPVYNVEKYLTKCLDSLINQTYSNLEIICVNDGSKDNSLKILNKYKENDKRIIVIDKKNGGVSSARNAGIDASSGEYITFVDSDDYIDTDAYENCLKIIRERNPDILAFNYITEPDNNIVADYSDGETFSRFDCFKNVFHIHGYICNKIFRRSIIINENIRCAETVDFTEDNLFLKMIFPHTNLILGCGAPYYHYVSRGSSISHSFSTEKALDSLIESRRILVNYYLDKNYENAYNDLLDFCLEIYDRIESLSDLDKKTYYSKQLFEIINDKLLDKVNSRISEENISIIKKLKSNL